MDQEKIGKFIKEIRQKEKMSQAAFGIKYGVTFQAVSKWENGKNIPDIAILKKICEDHDMNLDDFLNDKRPIKQKKDNSVYIVLILLIVLIIFATSSFINKNRSFEFKTLSTACEDFTLYGSMAYDDKTSSIYITNIEYCGGDDDTLYDKITCSLYETEGEIDTIIDNYDYEEKTPIKLEEFLKEIEFSIKNYERVCKNYETGSLHLEIEATDIDGLTKRFFIPIEFKSNCKN